VMLSAIRTGGSSLVGKDPSERLSSPIMPRDLGEEQAGTASSL
jgi:hypothetical protein